MKYYGQFVPPVNQLIYERYFENTVKLRILQEIG